MIRNTKRHPTVEDGVTVYANATVLGGETVIGDDSVVGGSVFVTRACRRTRVALRPPEMTVRTKVERGRLRDLIPPRNPRRPGSLGICLS